MSMIMFSKAIGPVPVSLIMTENHDSSIGITDNPIESGANVADHAYVEPKKITLEIADHGAAATYAALVRFQESRVPFTLVTGLYVYKNMLIKKLTMKRDIQSSRILRGTVDLQEAIIVSTQYTAVESTVGGRNGTAPNAEGGKPGGANSTKAPRPAERNVASGVTSDRASGTVMRGDSPGTTVPPAQNQSILKGMWT